MLRQSAFGLSLLLILFATGLAFDPSSTPAPEPTPIVASAPAGFVALDAAEFDELTAADAAMAEADLAAARGEISEPGEGFRWEYVVIFAVIAGAMAVTIAVD